MHATVLDLFIIFACAALYLKVWCWDHASYATMEGPLGRHAIGVKVDAALSPVMVCVITRIVIGRVLWTDSVLNVERVFSHRFH